MDKKKLGLHMILAGVLLFIVVVTVWCIQIDNGEDVSLHQRYAIVNWENGWSNAGGDVEPGEVFHTERTLPDTIPDNMTLCFRTDHTRVKVMVGDQVRYDFGYEKLPPSGGTPGSIWHMIELGRNDEGKKLTVETICPYDKYSGKLPAMMYGERGDVILYIFRVSFPLFLLSVAPIILAFLVFMLSGQIHQILHADWAIYAGFFLLIVGVWGTTESRFFQFLYGRAFAFQMLNFLVFASMPVFTLLVYHELHVIEKGFWSLYIATVVVFVTVTIANFTGISDYFNTLFMIHGIAAVVQVYGAAVSISRLMKNRSHAKAFWYAIAFLEQGLMGGIDIVNFYASDKFGNGFFYRLGLLIFLLIIMMISMQESYEEQREIIHQEVLEKMAYTDSMTGFGNRRAFDRDCEKIEKKGQEASIIFMDLNGLKAINDTYGHDMGDWAIRKVSEYIKAGEEYGLTCYRLGGDEFCGLIQNKTQEQIERMCDIVNQELKKDAQEKQIELSVAYGYYHYTSSSGIKIEEAVKKADQEMYERKASMKRENS